MIYIFDKIRYKNKTIVKEYAFCYIGENLIFVFTNIDEKRGAFMFFDEPDNFLYVQQSADVVKTFREEFPKARSNFIKKCARHGLFDEILTPYSLQKAKLEGVLPPCLAVHHKVPLSGGGTNDESNFVVLLAEEHYEMHKEYDKMLVDLKVGESILLPSYGLCDKQISLQEDCHIDLLSRQVKKKTSIKKRNYKAEANIIKYYIQGYVHFR